MDERRHESIQTVGKEDDGDDQKLRDPDRIIGPLILRKQKIREPYPRKDPEGDRQPGRALTAEPSPLDKGDDGQRDIEAVVDQFQNIDEAVQVFPQQLSSGRFLPRKSHACEQKAQ
ncbi:MAG: hypothetical protein QOG54_1456 [Actinomycetota bacterium]|jgi:hypothetical protein|nr:hypothetical protein [Actinomycetota bacterium]